MRDFRDAKAMAQTLRKTNDGSWPLARVGALAKTLRENPELRAATLPAVRCAFAAHDGPDGGRLNAATWIVTARAPAGL
jgi:hypothetical protein